ncbi:hypothetical protein [Clostridium estertheticum]|uniref:hypothetical protein n=1 Tax=Clostridium estertheticum TaxID=238834 RepID=UPI001C0B60F2|nr:hypothetical protein [Clostridium estertheticum]MBU3215671.1 hypothetical protein [Clostridium estertheticum]
MSFKIKNTAKTAGKEIAQLDMWFEEISETWMPSSVKERQLYLYYKYAEDNLKKEQILFIKNLPFECSLLQ